MVGKYLNTHRRPYGEFKVLAQVLGVSTRSLWEWKRRAGASGLPGRPAHDEEVRRHARAEVERVWIRLVRGHDGWRTVEAQLHREGVRVPTRLVQTCVSALKRERAGRKRQRIEDNRVHVQILARDALWPVDQTHVMRDEQGELRALVAREGFSRQTIGLSLGPPAQGADVVRVLEHSATQRGTWPHVVVMDNGSENKNSEVEARLAREHVIVLWNEPRTPQHNARAERGISDLKLAASLDKTARASVREEQPPGAHANGAAWPTRLGACARLLEAWARLDADTPRTEFDGLTPIEIDRIAPAAEDRVCRARFYSEICEELQRIALEPLRRRARRKLAREAIWCALERHGLVTRTRGGRTIPTVKAEGVS